MVGNVAYPIDRPSNGGLIAKRMRSRINHHVSHDTDVVHAAIDLEGVVMKVRHVVVVEIYRNRPPVPVFLRWIMGAVDRMRAVRVPIRFKVDPIVEVGYICEANESTTSRT